MQGKFRTLALGGGGFAALLLLAGCTFPGGPTAAGGGSGGGSGQTLTDACLILEAEMGSAEVVDTSGLTPDVAAGDPKVALATYEKLSKKLESVLEKVSIPQLKQQGLTVQSFLKTYTDALSNIDQSMGTSGDELAAKYEPFRASVAELSMSCLAVHGASFEN